MASLFDSLTDVMPRSTWTPEAPPCLDGVTNIYLNFETTGLRWWDRDEPIAISLRANGRNWYLPWGHRGGGNLSEGIVYEWAQRELPGKHLTNTNTRFDIHMARKWGQKMGRGGLDLEAMGVTVSDVSHYAALLDDHRQVSNLDSLITDCLGERPMTRLDESRMAEYHAGEAAPRSMYNVESVERLRDVFWPMLDEQDLQPVRELEDQVIYVVTEMENNGSPIDVDLLDHWLIDSARKYEKDLWEISKQVGFQANPDSPTDLTRVFKKLKIPFEFTTTGRNSFTDAVLKHIDHPTVALIRRARRRSSLRSKFLVDTKEKMDASGILRYSLHQLRATKDDSTGAGEAGTVTGRFSSTGITRDYGVNIQQRIKAAKQRVAFGYDEKDTSHDDEIYIIRKLHIAGSGFLLASDMDQAQYRIFASYANNPKIIAAYKENPHLSFHEYMHGILTKYATLTYRQQKDLNFAYLFGAGLVKMALMLGHITVAEFNSISTSKNYDHPALELTKEVKRIYEREVPEVKQLLEEAAHLAKPKCDEKCKRGNRLHRELPHRGYVKDVLGRRMRFPNGHRLHKAFNGVDQMTEATVMKQKLVELHKARHETQLTLRITNHDEIVGDIPDEEYAKKVDTLLNRQAFSKLRVPLTWSTGIGKNWAETSNVESQFEKKNEITVDLGYENTGKQGERYRSS